MLNYPHISVKPYSFKMHYFYTLVDLVCWYFSFLWLKNKINFLFLFLICMEFLTRIYELHKIIERMYCFSFVTLPNYYKLSDLKQHKLIILQFYKLEF